MAAFRIDPGPIAAGYHAALTRLTQLAFADDLWRRRPEAWSTDAATMASIANRLGWLGALDVVAPHFPRLRSLAATVREEGFTDIVLLGMGGSSLAPEVIRQVIGVAPGFPRFRMLDSVNPSAVRDAMSRAESSLFIVASKSGSTIEPTVMAAEARRRVIAAGHTDWGRRVIAITDTGSALHEQAEREQFRDLFLNPADIGGRYSALSYFGLVPAALMGADLDALARGAREMEEACRRLEANQSPGLALGAYMAAAVLAGRDKLTLLFPGCLQSVGLWIEQLVAESTGKKGKGIAPIASEDPSLPFGPDRAAVAVGLATAADGTPPTDRAAGAPVAAWTMSRPEDLGAEFFRWEVATAVASALIGVNPFDEPNVQQAKDATRVLLQYHAEAKRLPVPETHAGLDGTTVTLSAAAESALAGASPFSLLDLVGQTDYVALLAYASPDDEELGALFGDARRRIGRATRAATMFGYGPRYLHSTGQLHKGGPNNGVFLVITLDPIEDLPIPGESFTFGILERAQAVGDFQSLDRTGRRAMLVSVARGDRAALTRVLDEVVAGRSTRES